MVGGLLLADASRSVASAASDGSVMGTFSAGQFPYQMPFDGENSWVGDNGSTNLTKLRASNGANLGTFSVACNPMGLAFDGTNLCVLSGSCASIEKVRPSDGAVLASTLSKR
jgi:hypothetical protein